MDTFGIVVIVVSVVSAVVAVAMFVHAGRLYRQIGRLGYLSFDSDDELNSATSEAIRDEVERQLNAQSAGVGRDSRRTSGTPR
jgi:hypothetical protein